LLSAVLVFLGRLAMILARAFWLAVTGLRRLRVDSVFVNNAFMLSNGLVIIHWRVKNALWISIQGKWTSSRQERLLVYPAGGETSLFIRIQGLLSCYKRTYLLCPLTTLAVPEPSAINLPVLVADNKVIPVPTFILGSPDSIRGVRLTANVHSIDITIPLFQTENDEDKRLLHYSQVQLLNAQAVEGCRR
jgi:hypothetical protein